MTKEERLRRDSATDPILFYRPRKRWGMFSSFSDHSVQLPSPWTFELITYRTGEVRFQAIKATTHEDHDWIVDCQRESDDASEVSSEAKIRGRAIKLRDDWGNAINTVCWFAMVETVTAKALQHYDVHSALSATGQRWIYEDSPTDDIWGWRFGRSYRGKNLLGLCWMQARWTIFTVDHPTG